MDDRRHTRVAVAVLVLALVARVVLLAVPGYPADVRAFESWALRAGTEGVAHIYDYDGPSATTGGEYGYYDYPPLYAYVLKPAGVIDAHLHPEHVSPAFTGTPAMEAAVKIPPLLADLALAGLLFWCVDRFALGSRWIIASLYLAQPAVLVDSGRWGQPDAIHTFLVLVALTLVLSGRAASGWIAMTLACLMKPLALPFVPLLALATLARAKLRATVWSGIAVIGTVLTVFLPFLLEHHFRSILRRIVSDGDIMPFTTANAHNLWWLAARWQPSEQPVLGALTATQVGLLLFGIVYAVTARVLWASRGRDDVWFEGLFVVALAFFFFSTHLHENHLFAAVPFALLCARDRGGGSWRPAWASSRS
jgi:4-amino-4-deoxy-L-arabinose transferase-like glycosyltransferase